MAIINLTQIAMPLEFSISIAALNVEFEYNSPFGQIGWSSS
jgi:hypothetical protein